jgi:hypothetical protein
MPLFHPSRLAYVAVLVSLIAGGVVLGYLTTRPSEAQRVPPITNTAEAVQGVIDTAPAQQRRGVEDGVATAAELSAAWRAYADCAVKGGLIELETLPEKGLRPAYIVIGVPASSSGDSAALERGNEVAAACRCEHLSSLEQLQAMRIPTEEEALALYDFLEACVASDEPVDEVAVSTFTIYPTAPAGRDLKVSPESLRRYTWCAAEAEARTGFLSPPPFGRPNIAK